LVATVSRLIYGLAVDMLSLARDLLKKTKDNQQVCPYVLDLRV